MNTKWIVASIYKHFSDVYGTRLKVEPQEISLGSQEYIYEIRLDGPEVRQYTKNEKHYTYTVNILIRLKLTDTTNVYKIHDLVEELISNFSTIRILKLGGSVGDDGTFTGTCLVPSGQIRVIPYGDLNPNIQEQQSAVESTFTARSSS